MSDRPLAPPVDDAEEAWQQECLTRERRDFVLVLAVATVVFPLWFGVDLALESEALPTMAGLRVVGCAVFGLALIMTRRVRTLTAARAWFASALVVTSAGVAWLLPRVEHPSVYMVGYSAYFWGCAALSWPLRATLLVFAWELLVMLGMFALAPGVTPGVELVGAVFLVLTAGSFSTIAIHARRTIHRAAFLSSHALAARNAELEDALERLGDTQARLVAQEKLSALGRMLAGLSHEINNPLNVIKNNLEPIRMHVDGLVAVVRAVRGGADAAEVERLWATHELDWRTADIGDALGDMDGATEHIMQIHADLRAFIRGDTPDTELADVAQGLRATASLLRRRIPDAVRVELDIGPLPWLRCQPGQLNQVWLNLLQNALDAVGRKGSVRVVARELDSHVEVRVTDSGPGVSPAFRARLFEPFATTKPPGSGTGLGLAISYQIVQLHGGRLYLDDGCASGACFVVELPVPRRSSANLPPIAAAA